MSSTATTDNIENIQTRLEYLRGELRAERISYGELAELQIHAENGDIDSGDVELLEAAGVPEFTEPTRVEHTATARKGRHTKLPWAVIPYSHEPDKRFVLTRENGKKMIGIVTPCEAMSVAESQANATLIVEAVNSHTSLVAEVGRLRGALQNLVECSPCQNNCAPDDMTCATNAARAALRSGGE